MLKTHWQRIAVQAKMIQVFVQMRMNQVQQS